MADSTADVLAKLTANIAKLDKTLENQGKRDKRSHEERMESNADAIKGQRGVVSKFNQVTFGAFSLGGALAKMLYGSIALMGSVADLSATLISVGKGQQLHSGGLMRGMTDLGLNMSEIAKMADVVFAEGIESLNRSQSELIAGMQFLGKDVGSFARNMAFNREALGMSNEQTAHLADIIASTAAQSHQDLNMLIRSINNLQPLFQEIAATFGTEAGIAMEIASTRLIATFGAQQAQIAQQMLKDFAGASSDALVRQMMLGINPATMQSGDAEVTGAGLEQMLAKVEQVRQQAGEGPMAAILLESLGDIYGISKQQFNLARQLMDEHGGKLDLAAEAAVQQMKEAQKEADASRELQKAIFEMQKVAVPVIIWISKLVGKVVDAFGKTLPFAIAAAFGAVLWSTAVAPLMMQLTSIKSTMIAIHNAEMAQMKISGMGGVGRGVGFAAIAAVLIAGIAAIFTGKSGEEGEEGEEGSKGSFMGALTMAFVAALYPLIMVSRLMLATQGYQKMLTEQQLLTAKSGLFRNTIHQGWQKTMGFLTKIWQMGMLAKGGVVGLILAAVILVGVGIAKLFKWWNKTEDKKIEIAQQEVALTERQTTMKELENLQGSPMYNIEKTLESQVAVLNQLTRISKMQNQQMTQLRQRVENDSVDNKPIRDAVGNLVMN